MISSDYSVPLSKLSKPCPILAIVIWSRGMKTADLEYTLPERLIAQHPAEERDRSRLLIVDRESQTFREERFDALPDILRPGDCIVLNDTKVIRARLRGRKATGGRVEVFLLKEIGPGEWEALVRPSARLKPGTEVHVGDLVKCTVEEVLADGHRRVRFDDADVLATLERVGAIPLPPYIKRTESDAKDEGRYQTIYAREAGAVAAPTAGLHFSRNVFEALDKNGIGRATLTLHVGYGTFKPIQADRLEHHRVDPEEFSFPEEASKALDAARLAGGRVVAVGTTVTRVLETQHQGGAYRAGSGVTDSYIYPPYTFGGVDALLTNFHLPRSSLLALVCAFGGTDFILEVYKFAVENEFRFYSYGDAMLIL